jgi:hypothetical protein
LIMQISEEIDAVRIVDEFEPEFEVIHCMWKQDLSRWISNSERDLSRLSNHDCIGLLCKKL